MKQPITTLILLIAIQIFSQFKVSFTFDDGALGNRPNYTFDEWNGMLLKKLKDTNIEVVLFVTGNDKTGIKGKKNYWKVGIMPAIKLLITHSIIQTIIVFTFLLMNLKMILLKMIS